MINKYEKGLPPCINEVHEWEISLSYLFYNFSKWNSYYFLDTSESNRSEQKTGDMHFFSYKFIFSLDNQMPAKMIMVFCLTLLLYIKLTFLCLWNIFFPTFCSIVKFWRFFGDSPFWPPWAYIPKHCVNKWMFSGYLRLFICARLVELLETGILNRQKRFPSEQKNSKVLGQEIGSLTENHPCILI